MLKTLPPEAGFVKKFLSFPRSQAQRTVFLGIPAPLRGQEPVKILSALREGMKRALSAAIRTAPFSLSLLSSPLLGKGGPALEGPLVLRPPVLDGLFQHQFLHLYGVSSLANANLSQTVPFIKAYSLPASHLSQSLTAYSHRRSGKNTVRPGSRFHSYRASPHQTAFPLSGNGITMAFPVVTSDAINLSIPDNLSISFALVSSNKWM